MARKRFSDLERIYQALKLGNVTNASLPANLDFVKYAKWKDRETTRATITRPDLQGESEVGVIAFGMLATNAASKKKVTMTGRSKAWLNSFSDKAKFGTELATLTGYETSGNFIPAKARVAVIQTGTLKTSDITGRKYKDRTGSGYTVPHGQTSSIKHYQDAIEDILGVAAFAGSGGTAATHVISFNPEQFRRD